MLTKSEAADALIACVRLMAEAGSLPEITAAVRGAARRVAAADGATFVLRDGENCHYVDEDAIEPLWKGCRFPMDACISGWAMHARQQVAIPDIALDPPIPQDAYRPTFVRSLLMTPVRITQPWAAIGVYWARPYTPTADEAGWLQALADSTAAAMERLKAMAPETQGASLAGADVRMCAWTSRIFHDGDWISIEMYLRKRFGLHVTHGISPTAQGQFLRTPST